MGSDRLKREASREPLRTVKVTGDSIALRSELVTARCTTRGLWARGAWTFHGELRKDKDFNFDANCS